MPVLPIKFGLRFISVFCVYVLIIFLPYHVLIRSVLVYSPYLECHCEIVLLGKLS